ncbi:MAG: citryl-CoA lyase [Candidatus Yanofskybacteria bacterium]|nr:citryl-CoA lyase [Candidatus Yanofskybacteria bacterium]
MKFKTSISKTEDGKHLVRGHDILDLMRKHSFAEVLFLLWRGDLPQENEAKLLEAVLIAATENGVESPSVFVPRVSASTGNPMHVALAAGALSIGENHGGAAEQCARLLQLGKSAKEIVEENKIIPGFGHKVYKDEDPRAAVICQKAKELGFSCKYFDLAYEVETELAQRKGKKLPLNIDGAMAAAMLELKLDWRFGKAMFLIPRLAGAAAHVLEEMEQGNSYYRLEEGDIAK